MEQSGNSLEADPRPLSARSVMASLLLGRSPSRARGRDLVRWCGLFGIAPGTARVALHRMVAAGELVRDGAAYELAGRLATRGREQEESLAPRTRAWRGRWRMAVVTGEGRPAGERAALRDALRRARLAEWREGVWLRPDNLPGLVEDPRCAWVDARPEHDPARLAARLFHPGAWSARAGVLRERIARSTYRLDAGDASGIAQAFVVAADALRHVRADPLLPRVLLPDGWPGRALRVAYQEYQRSFDAAARAWFRAG